MPGADRVVLQRVEADVVVGPVGGVPERVLLAGRWREGPGVDAAVIADVHGATGDGDRVLIGVRGHRAAAGGHRRVEAREAEVPVRTDRLPRRAAVLGLVDLFEA